jgi:hypothetical protein
VHLRRSGPLRVAKIVISGGVSRTRSGPICGVRELLEPVDPPAGWWRAPALPGVGHNDLVGRHTGERAERTTPASYVAPAPPRRRVLVPALLVTATLVAWGVLVFAAIDFGAEARSGEPTAWVFVGLSTVGAAACLFVTLLLGARMLAVIRGREQPAPRTGGGHRANR